MKMARLITPVIISRIVTDRASGVITEISPKPTVASVSKLKYMNDEKDLPAEPNTNETRNHQFNELEYKGVGQTNHDIDAHRTENLTFRYMLRLHDLPENNPLGINQEDND